MLRVWLLGVMRIELDGVDVAPPSSRKARLLLAMLALDQRPHAREALAARLWPDVLDESARVSLRTALAQLRATLGPDPDRFLEVKRDQLALASPDRVWTDVGELDRRLKAGELAAAVELAGADLLTGLDEDWVYERRAELRDRLGQALERGAEEAEAAGDLATAVRLGRRQVALDSLAEGPHRELVRRLAATGDRGAALAIFERFAERLRVELGIVPSVATRELVDSIRAGATEPAAPAVAPESAAPASAELPSGVVTFLMTDIEGSSGLWEADPGSMADALELHDALIEQTVAARGGRLLKAKGEGDATLAVFPRASEAVIAAAAIQAELAAADWPGGLEVRVRAAVHTGEAHERAGDYFGPALNRAARLRGLAQGGTTVISQATAQIVEDRLPAGLGLVGLGEHELRGLSRPEQVFELRALAVTPPAGPVGGSAAVRKTVTVVFADVVDMRPAERQLDHEARGHVMASCLGELRAALERHGGRVEAQAGDVLMAVFGVPLLHEDDALRAVRAAGEMQQALGALGDALERDWGLALAVRVGIDTGEVITGGNERDASLATGEVVKLARRLCELAKPGELLIGAGTHRIVAAVVAAQALPGRGSASGAAIEAFRLDHATADVPPLPRRLDSPLVGRERQLEAMRRVLANAVGDRSCHLLTVLGAAGVGKSRLVDELSRELRDVATVLHGRCLAYGEGITFWPLAEVVSELTGAAEPSAATIAAQIEGEAKRELISELVAGALGAGDPAVGTNEETFWAARKLLEAIARRRPLVVILDDLHWAAPTFLDLVEHVADLARDEPILLLCMARPELLETRAGWGGGKLNATSLLLEPLDASACRELIANLLSGVPLADEVADRLADASEGNPLFAEELLAMLVDDGLLTRDDDHWSAAAELSELPVPATIHALLAARLERLPADEQALVARAAVEGPVFHQGALSALSAGSPGIGVERGLATLVRKEVIRPERATFADDEAFRFRHALIRDAAYRALPKQTRAELHERLADWLEQTAGTRLPEFEEIVGYHLEQAHRFLLELDPAGAVRDQLAGRASARLDAAGRRALARGDHAAAASLLERAAAPLAKDDLRRARLLPNLGAALVEAGRLSDAERVLAEAGRTGAAGDHECVAARALVEEQFLHVQRGTAGELAEAAVVVDRVVPVFMREGDHHGLCRAHRLRAWLRWYECRASDAAEAWEQAAAAARSAGAAHERTEILSWIASSLLFGPTPVADGVRRCEAIRHEVSGNLAAEAATLEPLAGLHAMAGRFDLAVELLDESRRGFEELGLALHSAVSHHEATVQLLAGDAPAAEGCLRRGYETLERMGDTGLRSTTAAFLAQALLAQGRDEEADKWAQRSRELAAVGDLSTHVIWRGVRARVLAARGDVAEAEQLARQAVALAASSDFVTYRADAFLALAMVHERAARPDEARAALADGIELYERKGNVVAADAARSQLAALTPQ